MSLTAAGNGEGSPAGLRMWKQLFLIGLVAFLSITILSYLLHWSWTGFSGNGTVWDWLNLFLLPIAVSLVPLVFESSTKAVATILVSLCLPLTVLLIGGYGFNWSWTGFEGNTLWDWLHLLLVPAAIPLAVRGAGNARARRPGSSTAPPSPAGAEAGPGTPGESPAEAPSGYRDASRLSPPRATRSSAPR